MPKTIITGRFDLLHSGHFNILSFCRTLAGPEGEVIVMLDEDARIKEGNPHLPIIPYDFRRINLLVLMSGTKPMIDRIVGVDSDETLDYTIAREQPDFLVKGAEWLGKKVIGQDYATMVFYKPTANGLGDKISSSQIVNMVLKAYEE
jgi:D-beta-D-heptose 7-phosphate kinase/D-beta-D-heptose 1-phosphate adenosyltransferase